MARRSSSQKLKVIALISGGKDSLFSILHCLANGHDVVALANLQPPALPGGNDERVEDVESFMYQTVGHAVIPLYADALGIPLFREEITGSAVDTGREYALQENGDDETEDLVPLLERAVAATGANALSTGAILSTYQRTRVETIAVRLGLVPLSYLWQYLYLSPYKQTSLLDDMRNVGQEARIIKVASGGLDESFLWQDVADQKVIARMKKRMAMFGGGEGGAVIGEGGEFETLALDGPSHLWKQRIDVSHVEKVTGEGGSAFARLNGLKLVQKTCIEDSSMHKLRMPPVLDEEFQQVLHAIKDAGVLHEGTRPNISNTDNIWSSMTSTEDDATDQSSSSGFLHLPNIMSAPYGHAADQMTDIIHQIQFKIFRLGLTASNIAHTTILLREMSSFAAINRVYGSLFTEPTPPSRVTVSCGDLLPPGIHIIVSLVVHTNSSTGVRKGLHVQSRSYWAPANIGPYSQAISLPLAISQSGGEDPAADVRLVHVAGQIPLSPASMEMATVDDLLEEDDRHTPRLPREVFDAFVAQSVLSLQHLWRIGRVMNVTAWTGAIAFLARCGADEASRRARIACQTWSKIHEIVREDSSHNESDDQSTEQDVWDIKNGLEQVQTEETDTRPPLPDWTKIQTDGVATVPVFAAEVQELPREAMIEWCSMGIAASSQGITYRRYRNEASHLVHDCIIQVSASSKVVFSYMAFDKVEAFEAFITSPEDVETYQEVSIYTTQALSAQTLSRLRVAMLVPCFALWRPDDGDVRETKVLLTIRRCLEER